MEAGGLSVSGWSCGRGLDVGSILAGKFRFWKREG
jgi:hypothetical protein